MHSLYTRSAKLNADSHTACRAHAVPLPCRAAKDLECVFLIWFTQCGRVWFTLAMPRSCHPRTCVLLKVTAQHDRRETACGLTASVRFLPAITRSSTKLSEAYHLRCRWSVWNQTPFVMDEDNSDGCTLQKKTICYTVGLAVRIFPATMRTFTKDTALSEQGRSAAWHV